MLNPTRGFTRLLTGFLSATLLLAASALLAADTLTIETAYGPVEVTGTPARIVTLYEGALDAAIASGASPVGAVVTRGGTSVAEYIQPFTDDIEVVGTAVETNLEAVIALRPDIILASPQTNKQQFQLLSGIAPTIVPNVPMFQPDSWIRETQLFARALDREQQGDEAIQQVRDRIAEVSALVESRIPEAQRDAAVVRWMPQGALVMSRGIFSATLVEAAGLAINDAGIVKEGRPHSHPLSQENLSMVDQSWLFLATLNSDGEEALDAARRSPAFKRLAAVGNDRVIMVDGQLWTSATGPIAAREILDDLAAAITNAAP